MLISERHKFVYLANPKTGTSSIEKAFAKYADYAATGGPKTKHITYRMFSRKFRFFTKLEIVVCVRDPIETLNSWYRYRQRKGMNKPQNRVPDISFEEYLREWNKDTPPSFAKVNGGVGFVLDKDGKLPDITYFRYGHSPTLHSYLSEKVGEAVAEEQRNVSPDKGPAILPKREDLNLSKLNAMYEIFDSIPFRNG